MTRRDSIYEIDNNHKHEIDNNHENSVKKSIIEISNNFSPTNLFIFGCLTRIMLHSK